MKMFQSNMSNIQSSQYPVPESQCQSSLPEVCLDHDHDDDINFWWDDLVTEFPTTYYTLLTPDDYDELFGDNKEEQFDLEELYDAKYEPATEYDLATMIYAAMDHASLTYAATDHAPRTYDAADYAPRTYDYHTLVTSSIMDSNIIGPQHYEIAKGVQKTKMPVVAVTVYNNLYKDSAASYPFEDDWIQR